MFGETTRNMMGLAGMVCILCTVMISSKAQAGPMSIWQMIHEEKDMTRVTFWGHPYPYGYAYVYRGGDQCLERRKIQTPSGWHWKKVWVCPDNIVSK